MAHFGRRIAELLDAPLYIETPIGDCDRVFIVGMYDPPDYAHTLSHTARAKKRHIHWCGTDVMLLTHPELLPEATHSADGEHLARELFDKGITARVALTPCLQVADIAPFPDKPMVGVYMGSDGRKYGASTLAAVMEAMPDYQFHAYALGQYAPEQMPDLIAQCSATLRLTRHDGGACSVREFMAAGRRAIATVDLPFVKRVRPDDLTGICAAIRRAHMKMQPDYDAAAYYQALNAPEAFLDAIEGWGEWQR